MISIELYKHHSIGLAVRTPFSIPIHCLTVPEISALRKNMNDDTHQVVIYYLKDGKHAYEMLTGRIYFDSNNFIVG